jgi:tetratricopeptide (TPR) repeat protein
LRPPRRSSTARLLDSSTTLDLVASLVDKSLLRADDVAEPRGNPATRYAMLETIRELASEQLRAAAEDGVLRRRHAEHYRALAQSANLSADAEGLQRHDLVIPERDNMRAALGWALETGDRELGLELFVALENFWATTAPREGLEWGEALLAGDEAIDPKLVMQAVRIKGAMNVALAQLDPAEASFEQALAISRELGDERAVASALHRLSFVAMRRNDAARAGELAADSLAGHRRSGGFPKGETQALGTLAWAARHEGDLEGALELLRESCELAEAAGFRWWLAGMRINIGVVSLELGRIDDARVSAQQALGMSHAMHDRRAVVYQLRLLAEIAAVAGDEQRAGTLLGAADAENERIPVGRYIHEWRPTASLDEHVGAEFQAGVETGRELSLDEAVAYALAT